MGSVGFSVRTVFIVLFVLQVGYAEGEYTVPNYLRCYGLRNFAMSLCGGQCKDASSNAATCGQVLDRNSITEWTASGGVGQWIEIQFYREFLINTIRVKQTSSASDQIKGLRLVFSDGSNASVELSNNEDGSSVWDVRTFADVSTTTVKIEVETIYTSSGSNGFKEIEFYHNNCIRDKLCGRLTLPAGQKSEILPLFGKTVSFSLGVSSAQEISVTLHEKPQAISAKYRLGIGVSQSKLYRSGESESESLKVTESTSSFIANHWWTSFWIDFRSSNLVLGSGAEILLQWNDSTPISVSYVSFTADSTQETTFHLCNRPNKCYKDADHYWPLDKVEAGTVYDLIGFKHGKAYNFENFTKGPSYDGLHALALPLSTIQISKTVDFGDFTGDCIGDAALCDRGITVGFWVFVVDGSDSDILHTAETATDRGIAIFYKTASSLLTAKIFSTDEYGEVSVQISTDTHYHVFVSWERGKNPWIVVNGVDEFEGTRTSTSRLEEKYTHLLAGVRPEGGGSNARLSHVVIWKRALSREEMMSAFHCFGLQSESLPCASIETADRIGCGWSGITEEWCAAIGCCYKDAACFKRDRHNSISKLTIGIGLSASSETPNFGAERGRVTWRGASDSTWNNFAWKPRINTDNPWLQVYLIQVKTVSAVATKGLLRDGASSYCQTYTLSYSKGGATWQAYQESDAVKVFTGNTDATSVVKNAITTPFDARYVRFYVKSWHNEPALAVEVYGQTTAKNYIGCYADGTFDVCGDYASDSLTPEKCTTCCGRASYQYSALRNGEQCLCSNALDANKKVGGPRCDEPCTGNIVLRCGGLDAYSVYQALGSYNFSLDLTMPENVSVYESVNAVFTSYLGASYTLDFGEDVVFTTQNASVSYLYYSDGQRIVYGHALLGDYGEAQMKSKSLAVNVYSSVDNFELNCPPAVVANQEFTCPISVYQGSNMRLEAHFTDGSAVVTPLDDARSYLVGELFSIPAGSSPNQSTNKTVLIPSYVFKDKGKLTGWRICSQTSGYVTPQVFRPVCGSGAHNSYCYLNGNCDADLAPCVNQTTTCSSSQVFSTAMGVCTDENETPANIPSAPLSDKYELITESHVYLSRSGCHIFHLEDLDDKTDIKEGDIVGFTYHGSGFAEITSRPIEENKELNASGFSFSDLQLNLGSILTTSSISPPVSASLFQYSLAAVHQVPSLFSFPHNYSIGEYNEEATVKGSQNEVKVTAHIVATESVENVTWTTPKAVATNATYTITIHPHKGYNITYAVDFGAGENETIYKVSLDSDLPVNRVYNLSGLYNIFLYATNIISFVVKACNVVVQDVVAGLEFYESISPVALGDATIIQWIMRQGNTVNITIDFDDGSTFTNGSFDVAYLFAAMNNHTYAAVGEYMVTINISNCVSNASIDGMAVVELPLVGVTCDVIHDNRDIEVNETVTVKITVQQGTNPEFVIDFGDGTIVTTRELEVQHSYSDYAFYNVSVSAYNNVSMENTSKEIQVHKPVDPLVDFTVNCSLTNLTDSTRCMLNITQGTDFTCTWDWGDGSYSETYYEQLGNYTNHTYSSVGHYNVALNCTNRLYNTTAQELAIVEVPIAGFSVVDPVAKAFQVEFVVTWSTSQGTGANFTITFTHVMSGMSYSPTVTKTQDTTSGSATITFDMMPDIGSYELVVTAINHVTPLQTISLPVSVDIPITGTILTRAEMFVEVYTTANFSLQITDGSNISLWWDFGDGSAVINEYYQGRSFQERTIGRVFTSEGVYPVTLFGNNSVSNFTHTVSVYIQNPPNITITSNSPANIPPGTINFTIVAVPGKQPPTNSTYTAHFTDGTSITDQPFAVPLVLSHDFPSHGFYAMNITVTNDVNSAFLEIQVELQTPIADFQVTSVHTGPKDEKGKPGKGPQNTFFPCDYPVLFSTSISNGTNVSYTWDFGDGDIVVTQNTSVNHSYPNPNQYMVKVKAENAVSNSSATLTIDIQCMVIIRSFTNDGPKELGIPITFEVVLDQVGTDSCYVVNISNALKLYKRNPSKDCPQACTASNAEVVNIVAPYTGFSWPHTYPEVDKYNVTITACNLVNTVIERDEAVCSVKPCKYPNVSMDLSLVGDKPSNAIIYHKYKGITIKHDVNIDCEATQETSFVWEVCQYFSHNQRCEKVTLADTDLQIPKLYIKPRGFPAYGIFGLKFTVTMVGVEGIYRSTLGYISIVKSDIEAVMDGGTSRAVGQGKNTSLSCTETKDPDAVTNNPSDFQYCWFCAKKGSYNASMLENCTDLTAYPPTPIELPSMGNNTNGTQMNTTAFNGTGCFGHPAGRLNASSHEITFNTRMMVAETDYDVCVQVIKDTRKSIACTTLGMTAGDPPIVGIRCASEKVPNCNRKINPSDKVALIGEASCETCTPQTVRYQWIILVLNDEWEEVADPQSLVNTPLTISALAVKPAVLTGGKRYKFRLECRVINAGKVYGYSEWEKEVNEPPKHGVCEVTPPLGYAFSPDFKIGCVGWTDDTKLIYSVNVRLDCDAAELPVSPALALSQGQSYNLTGETLPLGLAKHEHRVDVIITIKDEDDASTQVTVTVKVKMAEVSVEEKAAMLDAEAEKLDSLLTAGDPDAALSVIGGIASAMTSSNEDKGNSGSNSAAPEKDEEQLKKVKEMKEKLVSAISSFPPPSNPEDALKQSGALAAVTSGPSSTLSADAKDKIAESVTKMANVLDQPMSSTQRQSLADSLMGSIGAVLPTTTASDEEESSNGTGSDADAALQKALEVKDKILDSATSALVAGETFTVENEACSLMAAKAFPGEKNDVAVGGSCVGNLGEAVGNDSSKPVQMQMSSFGDNPHGRKAGNVNGGVTELVIKTDDGHSMNVSNLTSFMDIFIPAEGAVAESSYHLITKGDMLVLNLNVTNNMSAIYVWAEPLHNNTITKVFCRKDSEPTITEYDFSEVLPKDPVKPGNGSAAASCSNAVSDRDRYQLFIGSEDLESKNLTASGRWYCGFYYNGSAQQSQSQDDEAQRKRRETQGDEQESATEESIPEENNVTVTIFEMSCKYFDKDTKKWNYTGCKAGPKTTPTKRHCMCNHLTSFASDFFVPPNKIDWDKVSLEELLNNPLVFSVVCGIFCLYFLLLVWARRADRKDLEKVGVAPLPDNDPRDTYMYEVVVYTGFCSHAGTSSEIRMVLTGGLDETSPRRLKDTVPGRRKFCRGNVDYFLLSVPRSLGKLKSLRIWHSNTGDEPAWYLLRVMVHDVQTDVKTWFICDRWLAVEEDDGCVERLLTPASKEELTSFNLLFSTEARKNLTDGHLWFSVITRPAKSNFTRVQRLSCCLSILLCTMLANAMFYQVGSESSTGTSVHVGPFSFSIKQLSIGITSSLVVLPVNVLIVTFFRKARPAEAKPSLDKDQDPHGQSTKYEVSGGEKAKEKTKEAEATEDDDDKKKDKKKKKKTLPHCFIYISYVLCFLACTVSATFTVFYGLTFGKEKSAGWLTSMMISFWQDVLISQPLKVFAAAMFFAIVIKDPNKAEEESEQEGNELNPDEEALHDKAKNSEEEKALRKVGFVDKPPNPEKLEAARQLKLKQKQMKSIIREVFQYIFFLGILLIVAYGSRDPMSFSVTNAMRNVFEEGKYTGLDAFDEVSDFGSYWKWVQSTFIPSLMPRYWYGPTDIDDKDLVNAEGTNHEVTRMKNKKVAKVKKTGSKYSGAEAVVLFEYDDGFVADHSTARLVGTPRLRQLRVQKNKCKLLPALQGLFDECNAPYEWDNEDSGAYEPYWVAMPSNISTEDLDPTPWIYQTQWKLKGTPYWAQFASYWGGGYVADFGADRKEAEKLAEELFSQNWIDRYTRAVFAEFTIYNAQTNFFCVITMLSEILPTGGYYNNPKIQTIRLYRYVGPEMVFVMACELTYMFFLLYFLYKQVKKYRKERKDYFKDAWNYPELLVLCFSLSAVGLYFARLAITKYSLGIMHESPGEYVSFQYVAFIDEWVSATTAMAVFFSVLKFLRLLKFNRRVSLLMLTIKLAAGPLTSFMLMFFILFLAYCQFAYVVFGAVNSDYASFPATLGSMMSMTLGSFDFDSLTSSSRLLGPIFFFTYVVTVLFVLMNVFIGILNDALSDVTNDVSKQSNEHEILDFMLHTFKKTVGRQVGPAIKPNYKEPKNQFELNLDSIEEISENVQYAMRNLCMEDIRQTNWFELENSSKKKQLLMALVLETDEDFTENDICDSIPLFDEILGKSDEQELLRKLIYYREEKKLEEAADAQADNNSDKSSDDDDQSENDSDSEDDNLSVASGDSGRSAPKNTLRFVKPAEDKDDTERRSARPRSQMKLNASGTSEV